MTLTSAFAIYFIIWWLVLFAVLPFGSDSAHELGEESGLGEAPSAPKDPRLGRKFLVTTVLATIVFAGVYVIVTSNFITLDDIPFLEGLKPYS